MPKPNFNELDLLLDILRSPENPGGREIDAYVQRLFAASGEDFALCAVELQSFLTDSKPEAVENAGQLLGVDAKEIVQALDPETLASYVKEKNRQLFAQNEPPRRQSDRRQNVPPEPRRRVVVPGQQSGGVDFTQEHIVRTTSKGLDLSQVPVEFQKTNDVAYMELTLNSGTRYTDAELKYMRAHIAAAKHLQELKNNRLTNKHVPAQGEAVVSKEGLKIDLPGVALKHNQTSAQGCWSVAMELMLQSRGIELPQEFIRAYRSNDNVNALPKELDANVDFNFHETDYFDAVSNPVDHADLIFQTLPNTALRSREYVFWNEFAGNNAKKVDERLVSERIFGDIFNALQENRSPVALMFNGHYRTVVGADAETGEISFKDPMSPRPDDTYRCTVDDIVRSARTDCRNIGSQYKVPVTIAYLSDLQPDQTGACIPDAGRAYRYVGGKLTAEGYDPEKQDETIAPQYGVRLHRGATLDEASGFDCTDILCLPNEVAQLGAYKKTELKTRIKSAAPRVYAGGKMPDLAGRTTARVNEMPRVQQSSEKKIQPKPKIQPKIEPQPQPKIQPKPVVSAPKPEEKKEEPKTAKKIPAVPKRPAEPKAKESQLKEPPMNENTVPIREFTLPKTEPKPEIRPKPEQIIEEKPTVEEKPIVGEKPEPEAAPMQKSEPAPKQERRATTVPEDFIGEMKRLDERLAYNDRASKEMKEMREEMKRFTADISSGTVGIFELKSGLERVLKKADEYQREKGKLKSFSSTQLHRLKTINYLRGMYELMNRKPPVSPLSQEGQRFLLAVKISNAAAQKNTPRSLCTSGILTGAKDLERDGVFRAFAESKKDSLGELLKKNNQSAKRQFEDFSLALKAAEQNAKPQTGKVRQSSVPVKGKQ